MNKIKIVQIESFYKEFLRREYSGHPFLSTLQYGDQLDHLLESGWSSGQNVVPYLNPSQFEAHYLIPTHDELQRLWAKENSLPPSLNLDVILCLQLKKIRPQIIYISDIPCFNFEILKHLDYRPFIVAWHATSLSPNIKWSAIDLLLSGVTEIRNRALELGVGAAAEFMSASPNYMQSTRSRAASKMGNICFSGSFVRSLHDNRATLFNQLAPMIAPFAIDIYSSQKLEAEPYANLNFYSPIFAQDVVSLYSCYKIVLDTRADFGLSDSTFTGETSNMRIFEATKSGALLVTQASSNIEKYFSANTEIITYSSLGELAEKIKYFLNPANEAERMAIANRGQRRAVNEHSIEKRALWFAEIVFRYI